MFYLIVILALFVGLGTTIAVAGAIANERRLRREELENRTHLGSPTTLRRRRHLAKFSDDG
jgi:hypothetical protein